MGIIRGNWCPMRAGLWSPHWPKDLHHCFITYLFLQWCLLLPCHWIKRYKLPDSERAVLYSSLLGVEMLYLYGLMGSFSHPFCYIISSLFCEWRTCLWEPFLILPSISYKQGEVGGPGLFSSTRLWLRISRLKRLRVTTHNIPNRESSIVYSARFYRIKVVIQSSKHCCTKLRLKKCVKTASRLETPQAKFSSKVVREDNGALYFRSSCMDEFHGIRLSQVWQYFTIHPKEGTKGRDQNSQKLLDWTIYQMPCSYFWKSRMHKFIILDSLCNNMKFCTNMTKSFSEPYVRTNYHALYML